MLGNIRNKISGWWRKLNQPLVSELPVCVRWASFIYGLFFLCLLLILNHHLSGVSYKSMFGKQETHIDVSSVIAIMLIAFFVALEAALLFMPYKEGLHNLLLDWYKAREIKNFTKLMPLWMLFLTAIIGMFSSMVIPTMHWQYKALKNDELLLGAMRGSDVSLEDDWLEKHQIPMEQYAQRRQEVIKEGWDVTSKRTKVFKEETIFLLAFFYSLLGGMIARALMDIYFVWRFIPGQNNLHRQARDGGRIIN